VLNCIEVICAATTKALLMLRATDDSAREHASNRGIGVVSTLAEAITVLDRLQEVLPLKRGRLLRLSEWFFPAEEMQSLPANPRAIRPVPPYDPRR
jgi:hypothetical protein